MDEWQGQWGRTDMCTFFVWRFVLENKQNPNELFGCRCLRIGHTFPSANDQRNRFSRLTKGWSYRWLTNLMTVVQDMCYLSITRYSYLMSGLFIDRLCSALQVGPCRCVCPFRSHRWIFLRHTDRWRRSRLKDEGGKKYPCLFLIFRLISIFCSSQNKQYQLIILAGNASRKRYAQKMMLFFLLLLTSSYTMRLLMQMTGEIERKRDALMRRHTKPCGTEW